MTLLSTVLLILAVVVIAGVAYWALNKLAAAFGLPAPLVVVGQVVIVIVALVYLAQRMGFAG